MLSAVTEPVQTLSAILAGGGFATDALFLVMSGVCDKVLIEHPSTELCLFVDDLTLHATGANSSEVSHQLHCATECCIKLLEDDLMLVVSRGQKNSKTVAVHSGFKDKGRLKKKMCSLGVGLVRQAKLLGVDFSAGKKVKRIVQRSRISKVSRRLMRYKQVGKKAARHLVRTGVGPGMRYAVAVYGATNTAIKAARSFSCNAFGEMRGKSSFARLALSSYDIGALMATDPITDWAKAVWDSLVSRDDMRVSWKQAMVEIGTAQRPFAEVKGPCGAMVASALRIGWKVPSPFDFLLADGTLISLHKVAPREVQLLAQRALMHKEAGSSSLASRIGGPPDLEPLKAFLHTIRRTKAAESIRALGEGGWWTQSRLFEAGVAGIEDDTCKACHDGKGTLYHRCCGCSSLAWLMDASTKHRSILDTAQSAIHQGLPLFQHGVPHLRPPVATPPFVARWCGGVEVADFYFTGHAFTDGALSGGARKGSERSGWAAVAIDSHGLVIGGIYGTCPDYFPTSLRAELWAVVQALRHCCPPLTLWVDNAGVVDGFAKGRIWCCDSARPAADLWRLFWHKVEDLGQDGIQIRKVKGHASVADVDANRSTMWHKAGNDHADHFAGQGAALAEELASTEADRRSFLQAKRWYAWLATLAANWPADMQKRSGKRKSSQEAGRRRKVRRTSDESARGGPEGSPDIAEMPTTSSASFATSSANLATPSRRQFGKGHVVYRSGTLHWCRICGAYAEQRLKSLKESCQGAAGKGPRAGQLARLLKGEHPLKKAERLPTPVRVTGV